VAVKKSNRVVVIILACIVVGGVALWVGVIHWFRSTVESGKEWMVQGSEYGRSTDANGCLKRSLQLDDECKGIDCRIHNSVFLSGCLKASERSGEFCDGVPGTDSVVSSAAWRLKQCARVEKTSKGCPELFGAVQKYCEEL
jgi:hypothetical protein